MSKYTNIVNLLNNLSSLELSVKTEGQKLCDEIGKLIKGKKPEAELKICEAIRTEYYTSVTEGVAVKELKGDALKAYNRAKTTWKRWSVKASPALAKAKEAKGHKERLAKFAKCRKATGKNASEMAEVIKQIQALAESINCCAIVNPKGVKETPAS